MNRACSCISMQNTQTVHEGLNVFNFNTNAYLSLEKSSGLTFSIVMAAFSLMNRTCFCPFQWGVHWSWSFFVSVWFHLSKVCINNQTSFFALIKYIRCSEGWKINNETYLNNIKRQTRCIVKIVFHHAFQGFWTCDVPGMLHFVKTFFKILFSSEAL